MGNPAPLASIRCFSGELSFLWISEDFNERQKYPQGLMSSATKLKNSLRAVKQPVSHLETFHCDSHTLYKSLFPEEHH